MREDVKGTHIDSRQRVAYDLWIVTNQLLFKWPKKIYREGKHYIKCGNYQQKTVKVKSGQLQTQRLLAAVDSYVFQQFAILTGLYCTSGYIRSWPVCFFNHMTITWHGMIVAYLFTLTLCSILSMFSDECCQAYMG